MAVDDSCLRKESWIYGLLSKSGLGAIRLLLTWLIMHMGPADERLGQVDLMGKGGVWISVYPPPPPPLREIPTCPYKAECTSSCWAWGRCRSISLQGWGVEVGCGVGIHQSIYYPPTPIFLYVNSPLCPCRAEGTSSWRATGRGRSRWGGGRSRR